MILWVHMLSSELSFCLNLPFLCLSVWPPAVLEMDFLYGAGKSVGRDAHIDRARLAHKAPLPMASTEALESFDFSGPACKSPQGSAGPSWIMCMYLAHQNG